jgi:hypothetical protein
LFPLFRLRILPPANRGVTCVTHAGSARAAQKSELVIASA